MKQTQKERKEYQDAWQCSLKNKIQEIEWGLEAEINMKTRKENNQKASEYCRIHDF